MKKIRINCNKARRRRSHKVKSDHKKKQQGDGDSHKKATEIARRRTSWSARRTTSSPVKPQRSKGKTSVQVTVKLKL